MTFIGKLIVLLNLVVSVILLSFAIATYTQRLDRFNRKPEGGDEIIGQVSMLQAKLADLIEAKTRSELRWNVSETALVVLEKERPERQRWYAANLTLLENGKWESEPNLVGDPVRVLSVDADGKYILDQPNDRKTLIEIRAGVPLKNLLAYNTSINGAHGELSASYDELKKLINEEKLLTDQIIDTDQKGLRTLIREQLDILQRAEDEVAYLQPFLTNRRAESQLLSKRKNALQARLEELRRFYE